MARRISTAIALSLYFVFSLPTFAQGNPDPEKIALIKKLFALMNVKAMQESIMAASFGNVEEQILKGIMDRVTPDTLLPAEQQAAFRRVMTEYSQRITAKLQTRFQQKINFDELTERITIPLYEKNFSTAEIKDMIAFYETPTGQKTIKLMPQMTQESMEKAMELMMPQIMQLVGEIIEEEKETLVRMLEEVLPPPPPPAPKPKKPIKKR